MTRILLTLVLTLGTLGVLLSQTTLTGKIVDKESLETVPFATVAIYKNGTLITGTDTDFDGNYLFSNMDPGTYDVEASFLGYATSRITGVIVSADKANQLNFEMVEEGELLDEIIVTGYKVPLISQDETSTGGTITAESIKTLPTKNINALAATTAGLSTVNGTDINIRGARDNSTYVYIDGVRVNAGNVNNLIPQSEIEQLQVVTGGIEAKYGDVTGGVISITSKGPSEAYSGGIELETSHFLDPYGYKLASGNLSGPLLKKKISETQSKSIIGFRLSGQYRDIDDNSPSFVGVNRAPIEVIQDLEANPTFNIGETAFPRADTLTAFSNPDVLRAAPNERLIDWNVSAKIDARLSDNIDISISGGLFALEDQFTPFSRTSGVTTNGGRNGAWGFLNWNNNPFFNRDGYRGNFRFRHRLGRQSIEQGEENTSLIQNAYYTLQGGVEKNRRNTQDDRHGNNLFNYGYWGDSDVVWVPTITPVAAEDVIEGEIQGPGGIFFRHQEYQQVTGEFTPNLEVNPTIALYNSLAAVPLNGFNDPDYRDVWGIFNNVGQVYNNFFQAETDIFTLQVTSGFDLFPGSSDDGKHSIQFGFLYEQRVRRAYSLNPQALWTLARGAANRHFFGVTETVIDTIQQFGIDFPVFEANIIPEEFSDLYFFRRVRDVTGDALTDRVNVDGLTPDQLSLDLFAPGELISDVNLDLDYFGYDYLGNKLSTGTTFNDFFEGTDENGVRTFNVAPLQPVYAAGYIQDKFTFRDIIFRAGVRVDYFDANTSVLRDQYSLYEIESASEWHAANPGVDQSPAVGDDWKVYVQDSDPSQIQAYRDGDDWFTPNGTNINNPAALFSGSIVTPALKDEENRTLNITSPDFEPEFTFEDYTPQFNVMPRLAFSFPISDEAGFFAHYDVLVQRPPSSTDATALNYFYFETFPNRFSGGTAAGNPNLRPERTIDYQVGFQQKLSNTSAIKIAAYYRELRDMIQRQIIINVPQVGSYETFGNIDFGTVKGFTFSYDLRRTGNIQLKANYQLQFADGSGSDANSGRGLNTNGVIRELFPFSYDERHRINVVLDYRYGEGKQYTGPKIGGFDIFANTGANFIVSTASGRPYSLFSQIQNPFGQTDIQNINGERLPWIFNTDLRIDRQMSFALSAEAKKKLNANVYLRFENLFNTRNVIDVYNVSQSADDDGFLVSEFGIDQLNTINITGRDVEGYLSSYQWRLLNPNNFAAPRRIYLGVIFDF